MGGVFCAAGLIQHRLRRARGLKALGDLVSSWVNGGFTGFRLKHRFRSNFLTYHEATIENSYP